MITLLIATAIIAVMFIVMVQEAGLPAHRTGWVAPLSLPRSLSRYARSVGGKLMVTLTALIFLITVRIFAIAIK
jgi:hypothetical protein